jgi:hypothetical protein
MSFFVFAAEPYKTNYASGVVAHVLMRAGSGQSNG